MRHKLNLKHIPIQSKTRKIRHALKAPKFVVAPIHWLIKNRRGVNAVIANIILIGAVIVVGFATIVWSQYQSSNYQKEYTGVVNSNIEQLQEKIVIEYAAVRNGMLNVYLLNSGNIGGVTIAAVFVKDVNGLMYNYTSVSLIPSSSLDVGAEGYFSVLTSVSSPYSIKIVTGRGSTFASTY
jgi:hypothetical protein